MRFANAYAYKALRAIKYVSNRGGRYLAMRIGEPLMRVELAPHRHIPDTPATRDNTAII